MRFEYRFEPERPRCQVARGSVQRGRQACVSEAESDNIIPIYSTPAIEGKRDGQLNIRMSAEEKLILDAASRRRGYASVSDYIRSVAIAGDK
jgi:hypothetical protein